MATLDCLRVLSANEKLRNYIVQNGCVSILCSFMIQDPKELNIDILKANLNLLIAL